MTLNAVEFFTEEFLHAVRVPLEDAEFFSNVPVIVQQLQYRIRASHILNLKALEHLRLVAPDES